MSKLIGSIRKLFGLKPREEGATMVEYGLMVALIAVVCVWDPLESTCRHASLSIL